MQTQKTKKLVLSAFFLALALILPFFTGQIPEIGNLLAPMHFPVYLCGFLVGWPYALAVGFIAPLLRSVCFGMPVLFPAATGMAFELACYGFVSGFLYARVKRTVPMLYLCLVSAMVCGRLVWGAVQFVQMGVFGTGFTFAAFLSGALLSAIPGIVCQLLLIPALVVALKKQNLNELVAR